jgi:DNA-binding NarL/FixJ family response regulator
MTDIRILIVDDHPVFRFGLRALLSAESDMEVVAEAATGEEAVAMADALQPSIILMDINLPGLNGIEATRQILQTHRDIAVLIITMFEDATLFAAIRAGARGYIIKGADGEDTLHAIRAVARGQAVFSPSVAQQLTEFINSGMSSPHRSFPELTDREYEILELLARGYTNSAIAEQLSLSPKTVRNQVSLIFDKLDVADRAAAIIRAREAGIGGV